MNIALVSHNVIHGDGQGRVNAEIARYALSQGAQVTLVADAVEPSLLENGAKWIRISPPMARVNLWKTWNFAHRANQIASDLRNDVDVLIGCGFTLAVPHDVNIVHFVHSAWKASRVHPARTDTGLNAWYQWLYSTANARWERTAFACADQVVCVSPTIRDEVERLGISQERLQVIPNGVDPTEFHPGPSNRSALHLPDAPLALFVGDIRSPRKNLDTVLRALLDVPSLHLAVVGDDVGSPYPGLAHSLGLTDRVHFLGYRTDIPALMRAADVFVSPSHYEPFSLVVLEALASGCPVVTSRNVGASVLVPSSAGVVLDRPDDATALADALTTLVHRRHHNPDQYDEMRRAARQAAERNDWTTMARQYYDLFTSIAHAPARR